jgi:hypothetical protein
MLPILLTTVAADALETHEAEPPAQNEKDDKDIEERRKAAREKLQGEQAAGQARGRTDDGPGHELYRNPPAST